MNTGIVVLVAAFLFVVLPVVLDELGFPTDIYDRFLPHGK